MTATTAKLYIVTADAIDEFSEAPASARFQADISFAKMVQTLRNVVVEHKLYKVEKFCAIPEFFKYAIDPEAEDAATVTDADHPDFDSDNELRIECVTLNVTDNEFWFEGNVKHCAEGFRTEECSITELLEFFSIS